MLIEPAAAGNRQIVHYGGDNGTTAKYRKGTLHFYQNTVVSTRTDRTTLFRLSTNEEHADARNNIFYPSAHTGPNLSLLDDTGMLQSPHNWFKAGLCRRLRRRVGRHHRRRHVNGREHAGLHRRGLAGLPPDADIRRGERGHGASRRRRLPVLSEYVKHLGGQARPNDGVPTSARSR